MISNTVSKMYYRHLAINTFSKMYYTHLASDTFSKRYYIFEKCLYNSSETVPEQWFGERTIHFRKCIIVVLMKQGPIQCWKDEASTTNSPLFFVLLINGVHIHNSKISMYVFFVFNTFSKMYYTN